MARSDEYTRTGAQIINRALRLLRAHEGVTPGDSTYASALEALNVLVKELQKKGTKIWSFSLKEQTLVSGTATYTLDADTIGISDVKLTVSDSDGDVKIINLHQYEAIDDKKSEGRPVQCFYDARLSTPKITLHPVPNSAWVLRYQKIARLYQFETTADGSTFPEHWLNALAWAVAAELSPEYGKTIEERQELRSVAKGKVREAFWSDRQISDRRFVSGAY